MTAEVAVMNRWAVALAADSAMSVGSTGKTYPTNKLFALSKHHPVGVMIYSNAEFMGIPWETLIKMHRQRIGPKGMATITDYAESFVTYIGNESICTDQQKIVNLRRIAHGLFQRIAHDIRDSVGDSRSRQDAVIADIVAKHTNALREAGELPSMRDADVVVCDQETAINETIDQCFDGVTIGDSTRRSLHSAMVAAIKSVSLSDGFSGLVFAGFGEKQMFPSLVEVVTDGAIGNATKAHTRPAFDVDRGRKRKAVMAFGQGDMIGRFMDGVDRQYLQYLHHFFGTILQRVAREILEGSTPEGELTEQQESDLDAIVKSNLDEFAQAAHRIRQDRFVNPVLDIVAHLPKEELASMAEALVNLTSLKRRVSMEEESVGGPIDVAVISKGDGFIWIKRKHYFDPALNRDYFERRSPRRTLQEATSEVQAVQA